MGVILTTYKSWDDPPGKEWRRWMSSPSWPCIASFIPSFPTKVQPAWRLGTKEKFLIRQNGFSSSKTCEHVGSRHQRLVIWVYCFAHCHRNPCRCGILQSFGSPCRFNCTIAIAPMDPFKASCVFKTTKNVGVCACVCLGFYSFMKAHLGVTLRNAFHINTWLLIFFLPHRQLFFQKWDMSHEVKKQNDCFPLYWLVYMDPYHGLLYSPYNWVV